jgi:hypothetical protein
MQGSHRSTAPANTFHAKIAELQNPQRIHFMQGLHRSKTTANTFHAKIAELQRPQQIHIPFQNFSAKKSKGAGL